MEIEGFETEVVEEREMYFILNVRDPQWPQGMVMGGAWTKDGNYIGEVNAAERLCDEKGIAPEMRDEESSVCTIGFCEGDSKWYGWSHRALFGFGIGDKVYREDEADHGVIKTLAEAKDSASHFAESVS